MRTYLELAGGDPRLAQAIARARAEQEEEEEKAAETQQEDQPEAVQQGAGDSR